MIPQIEYKNFQSKRKFGVEIEVGSKNTHQKLCQMVDATIGHKKCLQMEWGYTCNNNYWCVKPDSSCGDTGKKEDAYGYEVVSPASHGSKHLKSIEAVSRSLTNNGANVNKYCGLHCQVDIGEYSYSQAINILAYWYKSETYFGGMVPEHRITNAHCKLFSQNMFNRRRWEKCKSAIELWNVSKPRTLEAAGKRSAITLINYFRTYHNEGNLYNEQFDGFKRPTVELRLPEGTIDCRNVKNWCRMFVHFVESVKGREFPENMNLISDIDEFLEALGLRMNNTCVLSPGLHETRNWVLKRLVKYSKNDKIRELAYKKIIKN